jgi:sialate O-acetylesterase
MRPILRFLAYLPLLAFLGEPTFADVRLPAIIGNNMVLQRDREVKLWGWADTHETVNVTIGGHLVGTAVAQEGRPWEITIPALKAGPVPEVKIAGKNVITLTNVLAGDVWLCSGQSNMAFTLDKAINGKTEAAAANHPEIRFFHVLSLAPGATAKPQEDCRGEWVVCNPQTAPGFSAAAYFFSRDLNRKLGLPVGIIQSAVGGTPAEHWVPAQALNGDPSFNPLTGYEAEYPMRCAIYQKYVEIRKKKAEQPQPAGQPTPQPLVPPETPQQAAAKFSTLYNSLIHPLTPFKIQGILWYQGETNSQRAFQYRPLLTKLITSWRSAWGEGDIPFLIIQLANFDASYLIPGAWAELREAQAQVASTVPNSGLAVTIDTGGPKGNLHPVNKEEAGSRAALVALKVAYGKDVVASGPTYESVEFRGDTAIVKLTNVGSGLEAKGDPKPKGFFVAGDDRIFRPAEAEIDGDTVKVRSNQVSKPVSVRYGWLDNPTCTLYNHEGLPAVPFRSDKWPGVTGKSN